MEKEKKEEHLKRTEEGQNPNRKKAIKIGLMVHREDGGEGGGDQLRRHAI